MNTNQQGRSGLQWCMILILVGSVVFFLGGVAWAYSGETKGDATLFYWSGIAIAAFGLMLTAIGGITGIRIVRR